MFICPGVIHLLLFHSLPPFVSYISDLSDGLECNPKLFADYISLFATEHNIIIFLDSTKLKIVWIKITTFFKQHVSIIL